MIRKLVKLYREVRQQADWHKRYSRLGDALRIHKAAERKKTALVQLGEILKCVAEYRCIPDHYFKYRLYLPEHRLPELLAYVPDYYSARKLFPKVNRHDSQLQIVLNNKILFNMLMQKYDMPITKALFLVVNKTFCDAERRMIAAEDALRLLAGSRASGVFVKFEIGDRGNTIAYWRRDASSGVFLAGEEAVDLAFLNRLGQKGNYLCEEALVQHRIPAAYHPNSVNTFRVITQFVPGKGAKVLYCTFRMGRGGSVLDNASKGGIFCGVGVDSGDLYPVAYDVNGNTFPEHPDSGVVFQGQHLPFTQEMFDVCIRGANLLPSLPSIGWDVAYTDRGPVVVEANDNWGLSLIQFPNGGIAEVLKREWGVT